MFLLVIGLFFPVMFFLQFFGPAIVTDNVGAVAGLQRSAGVVKRNLLATVGFAAINLRLASPGLGIVLLGAGFGGAASGGTVPGPTSGATDGGFGIAVVDGSVVYSFFVSAVATPFRAAFQVSFYDNHRPEGWSSTDWELPNPDRSV